VKSFEEICAIFRHIIAHPEEPVDYLTVRDWLQMRQHIAICEDCDKETKEMVDNSPKKEVDINFGGASAN